ncbi:GNAT family N-acetyltransferase [Leptospira sarikeiensis]|uniref:GNAT family N-acetyltransferase n=1 Tax=Leptospira sarikeiensis TaxID=2484943 RepID=A0A4R9KCJ1_9LEPT|nr:GNAT family N-acetyltransferase [Leptospira sarikeiensis]TGL63539.1 GNAT family N-acetyltransferase [Leptospira sarikeiensis]
MDLGKKKILPDGWREAKPEDLEILVHMEKSVFGNSAWTRYSVESHLAHHPSWIKENVGYLFYLDLKDSSELLRIGILPEKRKMGEAEKILKVLCDLFPKTILEVSNLNPPALSLYNKIGFSESGRRKSYYGPGEDAVLMKKNSD